MKSTPLGVLRKGAWDAEEDALLKNYMEMHEKVKWHQVPQNAGLNRCRKSCRLRWLNYLKPNIRRGEFDTDEVDMMIRLHKLLGNRWSLIAGRLPGRTANDVKNYWKTRHQKKSEDLITTTGASNSAVIKPRSLSFSASTLPRFTPINASDIQSIDNNNNNNNHHHHHLSKPPSQPATPPGNDGIVWWKELIGEIEFREEATPLMSSTCGSENLEAITGLRADNRPEEDQTGWSDLWDLLNFD